MPWHDKDILLKVLLYYWLSVWGSLQASSFPTQAVSNADIYKVYIIALYITTLWKKVDH